MVCQRTGSPGSSGSAALVPRRGETNDRPRTGSVLARGEREIAALARRQGASDAQAQAVRAFDIETRRQAGPIVEVGAAKDVVVVIQEGVSLEIKPTAGSKF